MKISKGFEIGKYEVTQAQWESLMGNNPTIDPQGPETGTRRVTRGGCYSYAAGRCKSASRAHPAPEARYDIIGFRLVRVRQ